jgi:formate dehydrogenase subunit gamma
MLPETTMNETQDAAGHAAATVHEASVIAGAIARHAAAPGGLLPLLHDVQDRLGYVPPRALPTIAKAVNRSRAEVHGVVTFYPHFREQAPGRHVLAICQAEACQAMGATALTRHATDTLGVALHATTADGAITLEPVYCLGNCACAPAVMVDGELHGRVDDDAFDALVNVLRKELA